MKTFQFCNLWMSGSMSGATNSSLALLVLGIAAFLSSCGGSKNAFVPPPPPNVTVSQPLEQEVINYAEFTGNTAPLESVELRARVRGFLKSFHFTPGGEVKKGDLLFIIEPEPYQVKVDQAKAELQRIQKYYFDG
jgi:membrane fusion protein (multidrug efflux system)